MATLRSQTLRIEDPLWADAWVDGLPVVPPTLERVEAMLAATRRDPQDVVGVVMPRGAVATVEKVAINAVMAGCKPEYLPVVLAAVEAVVDPAFNLNGVQATTHCVSPLIVVNGPVAQQLNINGGPNCFGSGWRANATIGRALRLVLLNIGGGTPGVMDKSTFGHPGKYTYCIAENEAESPWPSLQTDRGLSAGESSVTVFAAEAPHSVSDHVSIDGRSILTTIADSMATMGNNNMYAMGELMVVIGVEHARTLQGEGWTRHEVRECLYEKARRPVRDLMRGGMFSAEFRRVYWPRWVDEKDPNEMVPVVRRPEDLLLVVAGGTGKFSMVIPGWGAFGTIAVTKRLRIESQELAPGEGTR